MPAPPTLSSRAAATRNAILEAARASFAERGFDGTSARAIAERAGITQPLINHYFGSKEALITAVMDDLVEDFARTQAPWIALDDADPEFILRGLEALFWWMGSDPDRVRLMRWARLEGRDAAFEQRSARIYGLVHARMTNARDARLFREDVDIDMALIVFDVLAKAYWDRRATIQRMREGTEPTDVDRAYLAEILRITRLAYLR